MEKIVRCSGYGVEMTNPNWGQYTDTWLHYCPTCRKYRGNNEDEEDDE